jgi:hypothetical protein
MRADEWKGDLVIYPLGAAVAVAIGSAYDSVRVAFAIALGILVLRYAFVYLVLRRRRKPS